MIDEDKSLLNLVKQFIKQSPKHIAEQEAREAREAKREAKIKQLELIVEKNQSKQQTTDQATCESGEGREGEPPAKQGSMAGIGEFIIDSDNVEDIQLIPTGHHKENGELDLLDELQNMQDLTCYNLFRKKFKKGRKYREWKVDVMREDDRDQFQFLEKQLMRMRKKEEVPVGRKMAGKRNTGQL